MQRETTRRSLLSVGATGLVVGVAGCLGGGDDTASSTGDTETDEIDASTDERTETRDSLEGGVTSDGITLLEAGYYNWEIYQESLEEPDIRRIAIAEADAEITALVEWTIGESAFSDEISGAANQVGQELFTSQGSGSFWFADAYEHLWDDTAETLPIGDSAMESTQEELQYTVTGTETIQGLECHTLEIGRASCRERLVWCRSRWSPYH